MRDLDEILGTSTKVRLLRELSRSGAAVSGRHAARLAGLSAKAIQSLDELAEVGIVGRRVATGQNLYSFRQEHYLAEPIVALFAAEERKLSSVLALLRSGLEDGGAIVSAAIYGSVARGESGPGSDLDVLILLEDRWTRAAVLDRVLDAGEVIAARFGWRLSPFVTERNVWYAQLAAGDAFASNVLREAVVFLGEPLDFVRST